MEGTLRRKTPPLEAALARKICSMNSEEVFWLGALELLSMSL